MYEGNPDYEIIFGARGSFNNKSYFYEDTYHFHSGVVLKDDQIIIDIFGTMGEVVLITRTSSKEYMQDKLAELANELEEHLIDECNQLYVYFEWEYSMKDDEPYWEYRRNRKYP